MSHSAASELTGGIRMGTSTDLVLISARSCASPVECLHCNHTRVRLSLRMERLVACVFDRLRHCTGPDKEEVNQLTDATTAVIPGKEALRSLDPTCWVEGVVGVLEASYASFDPKG